MTGQMMLPSNKKLTVYYKMEPGCLGPDGASFIEDYCTFAQSQIAELDQYFINWVIEPRFDKTLPEIQYKINGKELAPSMVEKYLAVFDRELNAFEDHYNELLMGYIDTFLKR